jgi:hypothetical protein
MATQSVSVLGSEGDGNAAIIGSCPMSELTSATLLSNGASCIVDRFRLTNWPGVKAVLKGRDPPKSSIASGKRKRATRLQPTMPPSRTAPTSTSPDRPLGPSATAVATSGLLMGDQDPHVRSAAALVDRCSSPVFGGARSLTRSCGHGWWGDHAAGTALWEAVGGADARSRSGRCRRGWCVGGGGCTRPRSTQRSPRRARRGSPFLRR